MLLMLKSQAKDLDFGFKDWD